MHGLMQNLRSTSQHALQGQGFTALAVPTLGLAAAVSIHGPASRAARLTSAGHLGLE